MTVLKKLFGYVAAAALCASALASHAAVTASGTGAAGAAGGVAVPTVTFSFDLPYALIGFDFYIDYSGSNMVFEPAQSTIQVGSNVVTFPEVMNVLAGSGFTGSPNHLVGANYSLTGFFTGDPIPMPAQFTLNGVFTLPQGFTGGSVNVYGNFYSTEFDTTFQGDPFDVTVSITAVPEPGTWAMLLCGLGLLAAVARRRSLP